MRKRINQQHMRNGVTLIDPDTTYIDDGVEIGADTLIEAGVVIKVAQRKIGEDCVITASSQIIDSQIGDDVTIKASVVEESRIYNGQMSDQMHICVQKQTLKKEPILVIS